MKENGHGEKRSLPASGTGPRPAFSRETWLVVGSIILQVAFAQAVLGRETPDAGYRFSLDGKPHSPETVSVVGRQGQLAPGDLISVNNIWLTLGPEREYRFRSAREGVLLELPGGGTRWVGVRVEPNYGEGPDFIDGMAPLSQDEVRGLWGLRAEVWTRSCATKASWLDPCRVYLRLGQSASEGDQDLPELPRGLRYLEAMRFVGWKNLAKLRDLEFLDALPEREFDLRLIAGLPRLKVLRLFSGKLKHTEALATLPALESLDLRFHDEVTDIEFARSLPHLREVQIRSTRIRDLTPLADLRQLEAIDANQTLMTRLPNGPLPALRSLDAIATPVAADAVAAFRQAHPGVRVRHRWNESLRDALLGVTRVRVGPGEACGLGETAPAPYETTDATEIAELIGLLVVDEQESGAACGCLGGAAFEFFQGQQLVETTNLVCNHMLRWSAWPGDGALAAANATAVVEWLARRGVTGPRDEIHEAQAREAASRRKTDRAVGGMSQRLREAFEQDGGGAETPRYRSFPSLLAREFPVPRDRIRILLRILGAGVGTWSGLEWQEQVADHLLRTYSRGELEAVCQTALLGDDRQLRRGAARFWDSWQSPLESWPADGGPALRSALLTVLQESRSPDLRQRALSLLLEWWGELPATERERRLQAGLHDPSEPVRRKAMLVAGQAGATWAESLLLRVLGGAPAETVALPTVPADEEDPTDSGAEPTGRDAPSSEIAGLALGYLRSRQALPLVEERAAANGSAMLRVARSLIEDRCDLVIADDFRTHDYNQVLQLAAVESVVRCRGRYGLDLALGYRQATHWWEPERVANDLKRMLLAADPPGEASLKTAKTLPELRGWYQQYGAEYLRRVRAQ
jgi:hypothetical protein